ncbi:hypothetical protein ACWD6I_13890 [Streptomyces sp. NPDC002454]
MAEMSRAAAVMVRSGRSMRPETIQPSATENNDTTPSAMKEFSSSCRNRSARCSMRALLAASVSWSFMTTRASGVICPAASGGGSVTESSGVSMKLVLDRIGGSPSGE